MPTPPKRTPLPKRPHVAPVNPRAARSLPFSVSGEHFQLVPTGGALLCVARVSPEQARLEPQATLTRRELSVLLYEQDIPTVQGAALAGFLSSLQALPRFESHATRRFSLEPGTSRVSQSAWRGGLGEVAAQYTWMFPQQNLNALHPNHPIFDLRTPLGGLNSVKTSVRTVMPGQEPFATYLRGLGDVLGLRAKTLELARQKLYPQLSRAEGQELILRNGYISVNEDHVEPFRAALRDPANYRKQVYWQLANQLLRQKEVRIGNVTYRDYVALERAAQRTNVSEAVRRQLEAAMHALRQALASRVDGNGITTQHLIQLRDFRLQIAAANLQMTPEQIRGWAFPELIMVARHGGGLRGNVSAARVAGANGAVGGAVVSIIIESGQLFYAGEWETTRVLRAGAAGGVSGWVGGATQSLVMGNAGNALSRNLLTQGFNSSLAAGAGRGLGGFAAGGLAAPVFATTSLALDDQEHSSTDYVAAGTRAFVAGSLSSALAAGAVGAIWGTEVPVVGNIVGFIIGFGGYYVFDSLAGEQIEQGVRQGFEGPTSGGR